jgi:peptide/nickel transport system substrate-binding protein
VKDSPITVGSGPAGIAVSNGAAWVANNLEGSLSRIDIETLRVTVRTLSADGGAYGVAARGGDVWVSNEYASTLMRVTAEENFRLAANVRLQGAPLGLAYAGKDLWFTNAQGGTQLHHAGVLRIVGSDFAFDDFAFADVTIHYDEEHAELAAITNDCLVSFRHAGGVQGAAIVPDLATSRPTPTDGGLTYTFHLRKRVLYSTGAPVLAGDIRRGIERTVMHPDSTAPYYPLEIVGAEACAKAAKKASAAKTPLPACDLSGGINADDQTGTITFHLTRPTPGFVDQLALSNASAVPQDTPLDLPPGAFLPATGPYMIRSYSRQQFAKDGSPVGHGRLELVRNPHFHVWAPAAQPAGYPDRIVLETGYTTEEAVTRVATGRADLVWGGVPASDVGRLGARYGTQLHTNPGNFTQYLVLNATKPPFSNLDARRALAYALDRRQVATALYGPSPLVTCQLIPPQFPGYQRYCPFTVGGSSKGPWTGTDLATARTLVRRSGTRGAKVTVAVYDFSTYRAFGRRIVNLLEALGYRATMVVRKDYIAYVGDPTNRWDAATDGWAADFPAASNFIAVIGSCDPDVGTWNHAKYCNTAIEKRITATLAQQVADPGKANEAWAALDRSLVDAAAIIPFDNSVRRDFVSRRVANLQVNPLIGTILSQMWVQ